VEFGGRYLVFFRSVLHAALVFLFLRYIGTRFETLLADQSKIFQHWFSCSYAILVLGLRPFSLIKVRSLSVFPSQVILKASGNLSSQVHLKASGYSVTSTDTKLIQSISRLQDTYPVNFTAPGYSVVVNRGFPD
jgi:hypothetical protein